MPSQVKGILTVEKFRIPTMLSKREDEISDMIRQGKIEPDEIIESLPNTWFTAGWTVLLNLMIAKVGTNPFSATYANIQVGNGSTAFNDAQTACVGGSVASAGMLSGWPTSPASGLVTFKAQFSTSVANFIWEEFCLNNGTTSLNRGLTGGGGSWTKTSAAVWNAILQTGKT
jgi:hypothetical protein